MRKCRALWPKYRALLLGPLRKYMGLWRNVGLFCRALCLACFKRTNTAWQHALYLRQKIVYFRKRALCFGKWAHKRTLNLRKRVLYVFLRLSPSLSRSLSLSLYTYIYVCICMYVCTYTYIYTDTDTLIVRVRKRNQTLCSYTHARTHKGPTFHEKSTHTYTHIHTHTHTHKYRLVHTHTLSLSHTNTQTHTHTNICTHTQNECLWSTASKDLRLPVLL